MSPAVGLNAPEIRFIMVVLPDPFGPIRPSTSFSASLNDMLSTATRPPKRLVTPEAARAVAVPASGIVALLPLQQAADRPGYGVDRPRRAGRRAGATRPAAQRVLDEAGNAARNYIDDEQEADAQEQRGLRGEIDRDQLPQQHERNNTEQRPSQPVHAAQQRHYHHLERHERAERDARL